MRVTSLTCLAASLLVCSLAAQKPFPDKPPAPVVTPLAKVVPEDPAKYAAAAALWFPVMEQSLDAAFTDQEVKGVFRFKNPRDRTIDWKHVTGSCTCSMAVLRVGTRSYELRSKTKQLVEITGPAPDQFKIVDTIPVGAGEQGEIEVHVDTHGAKVSKVVSVDIHTTDTEAPMVRLQLRVGVQQAITVSPADVSLGIMGNGETREFAANVTSIVKDFAVMGASPFPKGVTATYERIDNAGTPVWRIKGSFRQDNVGDSNVTLEFQTNVKEAPTFHVRVHASVRAPIEIKPAFFLVGRVQKGKTGSAKVTFTAADGKNLEATAMHVENLNVPEKFVTLHASKDGANLVVELEVAADAPTGLIKGEVVVDLDHPVVKQRRILFNGFVR